MILFTIFCKINTSDMQLNFLTMVAAQLNSITIANCLIQSSKVVDRIIIVLGFVR